MKSGVSTFLLVALVLIVVVPTADARDKITAVHYDVGYPGPEMDDYIDEVSWRGFGIDFRHFRSRSNNFTIGFSWAWQVFDQRSDSTVVFEGGAVTGLQRRYVNSLPFLLTFHWYSSQQSNRTRVFLGAGAGAYYIVQRLDIGVQFFEESNWHFGVMPEAGLQIPMGDVELYVSARYHYAFAAGTSIAGDGKAWDYLTGNIGLAWSRW